MQANLPTNIFSRRVTKCPCKHIICSSPDEHNKEQQQTSLGVSESKSKVSRYLCVPRRDSKRCLDSGVLDLVWCRVWLLCLPFLFLSMIWVFTWYANICRLHCPRQSRLARVQKVRNDFIYGNWERLSGRQLPRGVSQPIFAFKSQFRDVSLFSPRAYLFKWSAPLSSPLLTLLSHLHVLTVLSANK